MSVSALSNAVGGVSTQEEKGSPAPEDEEEETLELSFGICSYRPSRCGAARFAAGAQRGAGGTPGGVAERQSAEESGGEDKEVSSLAAPRSLSSGTLGSGGDHFASNAIWDSLSSAAAPPVPLVGELRVLLRSSDGEAAFLEPLLEFVDRKIEGR